MPLEAKPAVGLPSHGVIDPTKVVRNVIQGAASVAGLLITTEAMVAEHPKKKRLLLRCRPVWAVWTTIISIEARISSARPWLFLGPEE